MGLSWWFSGKESACQCRRWVGKIPWSREWLPTPVFLPGEFRGLKSLAGYTVHGVTESNLTEQLALTH